MRTANENEVESCFVVPSEGWSKNRRWIREEYIEEEIVLSTAEGDEDDDDEEEEAFDCMRSLSDDQGFTVHGLCKYTNEHEFSHGAFVYAWEVYMTSDRLPDSWSYCESFSLEVRDEEAERYEIMRIADQYAEWVEEIVEYETTGVCPHVNEPGHDEINSFIDRFLSESFGPVE